MKKVLVAALVLATYMLAGCSTTPDVRLVVAERVPPQKTEVAETRMQPAEPVQTSQVQASTQPAEEVAAAPPPAEDVKETEPTASVTTQEESILATASVAVEDEIIQPEPNLQEPAAIQPAEEIAPEEPAMLAAESPPEVAPHPEETPLEEQLAEVIEECQEPLSQTAEEPVLEVQEGATPLLDQPVSLVEEPPIELPAPEALAEPEPVEKVATAEEIPVPQDASEPVPAVAGMEQLPAEEATPLDAVSVPQEAAAAVLDENPAPPEEAIISSEEMAAMIHAIEEYLEAEIPQREPESAQLAVTGAPLPSASMIFKVEPAVFTPDGDGVDDLMFFRFHVERNTKVRRWKLEIFEIPNGDSETSAGHQDPRLFIDWSGTGLPPWQIVWDGRDVKHVTVESATGYQARFTWWNEVDERQELSAKFSTGLLIRKEGGRLKISVPSVIFRANHADFAGLPASVVENNYRVVAQIARILRKYPDYHIRIEGHANNVGKMIGASPDRVRKEELEEVWPLSTARARKIQAMLVSMGVDPSRLYIEGFGSSEPRFSFTDEQNRWKNRRVEFVLIRH